MPNPPVPGDAFVDVREKTAALATALNVFLTAVKFALYSLTGSLAILAEAWHSFSDIATSALTFVAVRRTVAGEPKGQPSSEDGSGAASEPPSAETADTGDEPTRTHPSAEQVTSLVIGVVILIAGLTLVSKVLWYQPVV